MPDSEARFQCRHILADGRRCRSACLRHEDFCYYHHASRKPVANPAERKGRRSVFTLPRIEDRASILLAINEILTRIAANDIDARRAGRLLYALQIAACSMPRLAAVRPSDQDAAAAALVEEVVLHPTLGEIAPRSELARPVQRKSLAQELREEMEELEARNIAEFGASADVFDPVELPGIPMQTNEIPAAIRAELAEAREELESRQDRIHGMHKDLAQYREDLATAKAQLAEAHAANLRAEECMVWHMDRHGEARAALEALQPTANPQLATGTRPSAESQPHTEAQPQILPSLHRLRPLPDSSTQPGAQKAFSRPDLFAKGIWTGTKSVRTGFREQHGQVESKNPQVRS